MYEENLKPFMFTLKQPVKGVIKGLSQASS